MDSGLRVALQQRISHKSFPLVEPQQLEVVDPQRFSTVTFTRVSYQSPNADRDTGRAWRIVAWHGKLAVKAVSPVSRSDILPCEKKFDSQGDHGEGLQQRSRLRNQCPRHLLARDWIRKAPSPTVGLPTVVFPGLQD